MFNNVVRWEEYFNYPQVRTDLTKTWDTYQKAGKKERLLKAYFKYNLNNQLKDHHQGTS